MEICRSLLQVFFLLFRGKETSFLEKQKHLCKKMDLDGYYVKMWWVNARQNDYLILVPLPYQRILCAGRAEENHGHCDWQIRLYFPVCCFNKM